MMTAIIVGTILILFFMWLQYSKLKCTKKIDATYLKFNIYNHHGMFSSKYIPVFKYKFNGNEYENQAQQSFSKKSTKNFIVGEKYTILNSSADFCAAFLTFLQGAMIMKKKNVLN